MDREPAAVAEEVVQRSTPVEWKAAAVEDSR